MPRMSKIPRNGTYDVLPTGKVAPTSPVKVSGSRPPNQPLPKWYGIESDV